MSDEPASGGHRPLDPLGKRALYWAPATRDDRLSRPDQRHEEAVPGKHSLFTAPEAEPERGPLGRAASAISPITIECSTCRAVSRVDLARFVALHFPLWLWRPGKGFSRLMRCPSCGRRTWVSASWTP